ncbi:hypothetical protein ACFGVR_10255 [Mucilaginibacter sp. AW1-3]
MNTALANTIYRIALLAGALAIWYYVWLAHQLDYDENFGAIIFAIILSMVLTLSITVMWFLTRALILQNKLISLSFLIIASPITILLFIYVYQAIAGRFFSIS